jgi:hypothetical protein
MECNNFEKSQQLCFLGQCILLRKKVYKVHKIYIKYVYVYKVLTIMYEWKVFIDIKIVTTTYKIISQISFPMSQ